MSREVRRVPVDWRHPTEPNPHWQLQRWTVEGDYPDLRRVLRPESRLHGPTEQFVSLYGTSVTQAQAEWDHGLAEWEAGTHESLEFDLRYHCEEGYLNRDGTRDEAVPYRVYAEDGETVVREFFPKTTAEIAEAYPYEEYAGPRPTEATHMPDFEEGTAVGWCLYQTISEGTPTTPVFATAEELVEHLATVGEDHDQEPYRREAAEALVSRGSSIASLVVVQGEGVLSGSKDIDRIQGTLG